MASVRDRVVDLVRAASILVVVLGHWTMGALTQDATGAVSVRNVLEVSPLLQAATWLFQVMPLFFFAAGFANATSLWHGRSLRLFLSGRIDRVLRPVLPFLVVWLVLAQVLLWAGVPHRLVVTAGANAAMVLWFLAVYLLLALVAPAQVAMHRRHPWALVLLLPPVALALDQLQGTSWAGVGLLNYAVVFAFCQQLGILYADGRLLQWPPGAWWAGVALALLLLVVATGPGPYPVSMIGLPGQEMSNMLPPSVCVVLVAVLQVSLVMLLRPHLARWLEQVWLWKATVLVNLSVLTVFLWHLTAFVAVAGVALALEVPLPEPGSLLWWGHKLVWVLACAVVTVLLVLLLRGAERTQRVEVAGRWAVAATVLAVVGLAMVAAAGFADPFSSGGVSLAGQQFAAAPGAALVAAGWLLSRRPTVSRPAVAQVPGGGGA
jgi:hypothetical protein